MLIIEIWKDIKDYEGYYQVSNYGNVKSLPRYSDNGRRNGLLKERILAKHIAGSISKYYSVNLFKYGKRKYCPIHVLVFETFVQIVPKDMTVNHKDGNSLNNELNNLELITLQENIQKSRDNNIVREYKANKIKVTNLETNEVIYFENANKASIYVGVCSATIRNHANRIYKGIINNKYKVDIA